MNQTITKLTFPTIERLIDLSRLPLPDSWLEALQHKFEHHETYYRFLYHLVIHKKPRLALEIGTYFGIGSAYMAAAAQRKPDIENSNKVSNNPRIFQLWFQVGCLPGLYQSNALNH